MKNNKGFSTLELMVSFTLTMIIVVILFEIIISLKNVYENSVTKTALVSKQNLLTDYIYSDINDYGLQLIDTCGDNCINFTYNNNTSKQLSWEYESENNKQSFQKIKYGDYATELISNSKFDLSVGSSAADVKITGAKVCASANSFISIKIPITNSKFPNEDFGLNIVHVFDDNFEYRIPLYNGGEC